MTPIEQLIDSVAMEATGQVPSDGGLPVLTHRGVLKIFDREFQCGRLITGQAIFFGEEFENFLREMLT